MKEVKIKDICDKGSSNLRQKDVENKSGKYPVFGASGQIGNIDIYHQDKEYIAIVKDGSGIGRVSFMPAYSSVIGTLQYILPKKGYNIKYIAYCLQSLDLANYKQGAAIPHIYFRDYGEYIVKVEENEEEQQRIVSLLDAEFEYIDILKRNAEHQLQAAKDCFSVALRDIIAPHENWNCRKLGDICDFEGGSQPPKNVWIKEPSEGYVRMLQIRDFTKSRNSDIEYVKQSKKLRLCKADDILIGRYGASVGKILTGLEGAYNVAIIKSIPKEEVVLKTYIRRYFESPLFQSSLFKICNSRTAQAGFSKDDISDWLVPLPSLSEQKNIADKLDALSDRVKALQSNYDQTITLCNDLKQALLKSIFE